MWNIHGKNSQVSITPSSMNGDGICPIHSPRNETEVMVILQWKIKALLSEEGRKRTRQKTIPVFSIFHVFLGNTKIKCPCFHKPHLKITSKMI